MVGSQGGVPGSGNPGGAVPGQDYYTIVPGMSAKQAPAGQPFAQQMPGASPMGQVTPKPTPQAQPWGQQGMPGAMPGAAQGGMPGAMPGATPGGMPGAAQGGMPGMSGMPQGFGGGAPFGGMPQGGAPGGFGSPAMSGAIPGAGSIPGGMPGAIPGAGAMPGAMPGSIPGAGAMPGAVPGGMPGAIPGGMPGATPGGMPGAMPSANPAMSGAMPAVGNPAMSGAMPAVGNPAMSGAMPAVTGQPMQGGAPASFGNPAMSGPMTTPGIGSPSVTGGIGTPIRPENQMAGAQAMPGAMPGQMPGQAGAMPGQMPGAVPGAMPGQTPGDAAAQQQPGMQDPMAMQQGSQVNIPVHVPGLAAIITGVLAFLFGLIPLLLDVLGIASPDVLLEGMGFGSGGIMPIIGQVLVLALPVVGVILGIVCMMLAKNASRAYRPNGKATVGRIAGVMGIMFSAVSTIIGILLALSFVFNVFDLRPVLPGSASFFETIFDSPTPSSGQTGSYVNNGAGVSSGDSSADTSNKPMTDTEQAEAEIKRLATAEMDQLANKDPNMVNYIAAMAEEDFAVKTGFTMEECGLSPQFYAESMLTDFSYTIKSTYADIDAGNGIAYVDIKMRSIFGLLDLVDQKITAVNQSGPTLTRDQTKAEYKRIYEEALAENTTPTDALESIKYNYENGQWVLDQEAWDESIDYLFGLGS